MGWFNKKKEQEQERYHCAGIKDCVQFRNELARFMNLDKTFREKNKIFSFEEMDKISEALSQTNPINVR
jgi:hypothetical protein